eukprot:4216052-Pyramimonas_sp.AAC.1
MYHTYEDFQASYDDVSAFEASTHKHLSEARAAAHQALRLGASPQGGRSAGPPPAAVQPFCPSDRSPSHSSSCAPLFLPPNRASSPLRN